MKKHLTAVLSIALGAALAVGSVTCAYAETENDEKYIAMIALGYSQQFWQAVKSGADQAAEDYGVKITFEGPEQETMVDKQVDMLRTAIQNNPDAIAMAAIDVESVRTILQEEKDKGIPILGFDSGLGDELPDVTVSTDNAAAGKLAAEHAAELIGDSGKICILGHTETVQDGVARVEGFRKEIEENHPDIEIVDTQYADGDQLKSAEAVKGMINSNSDIKLVYTTNEASCIGAYNGLKELNKIGEVQLVGFDSSKILKQAIRSGKIAGAITQDPITEGYKTVEYAVKLIKGEKVDETFVDAGFYWYDASNMDDEKIAPCLYD